MSRVFIEINTENIKWIARLPPFLTQLNDRTRNISQVFPLSIFLPTPINFVMINSAIQTFAPFLNAFAKLGSAEP